MICFLIITFQSIPIKASEANVDRNNEYNALIENNKIEMNIIEKTNTSILYTYKDNETVYYIDETYNYDFSNITTQKYFINDKKEKVLIEEIKTYNEGSKTIMISEKDGIETKIENSLPNVDELSATDNIETYGAYGELSDWQYSNTRYYNNATAGLTVAMLANKFISLGVAVVTGGDIIAGFMYDQISDMAIKWIANQFTHVWYIQKWYTRALLINGTQPLLRGDRTDTALYSSSTYNENTYFDTIRSDNYTRGYEEEWVCIGNEWFYYDYYNKKVTGWLELNSTWYYLNPNNAGRMQRGWIKIGGLWYYLYYSGAMAIGWLKDNGSWYYLGSSGVMQTSTWINEGGCWYYIKSSGIMATGWYMVDGTWYYFYGNGLMATNTTIDGWTIGSNGAAYQ